jgi:hypothetical protein
MISLRSQANIIKRNLRIIRISRHYRGGSDGDRAMLPNDDRGHLDDDLINDILFSVIYKFEPRWQG